MFIIKKSENINEYINFFVFNGLNTIEIQIYKYLL